MFSECDVPSSVKDFVDTATTASGTGAAAFMAFLAVLCLTAIMSLAEECKSLSSRTEEEKGNRPLLNQFSIPTVAASVMPPVAVALSFVEGRDLMGALHFNGAFMIPFLYGLLPIILYRSVRQYDSRLGSLFNKQFFTSVAGCRNIMCSQKRDHSRYIMASKLLSWQCRRHVGNTSSATCRKVAKVGSTCVLVPTQKVPPHKNFALEITDKL
jgi:hypothetical protein